MKRAISAIALSALCTTSLACSSDAEEEHKFSFGAPEMQAAAGGDWTGTLQLTGSPDTTHQLHLEYTPAHNHPACESRTLTDPLCVVSSSMGFVGTLSSADMRFDQTPVHATFMVHGETLKHGDLGIEAGSVALSISYVDGVYGTGNASENGSAIGTFTLQRP
jgi:hypothetical protein